MEKDDIPGAMPSVLKGFTMIGQPIRAAEFEKAFGYKMPKIELNDDEKRQAGLNIGLESTIRAEEKQPATETVKIPETSFGQKFMSLIQPGNTQQTEQPTYQQQNPQTYRQPEQQKYQQQNSQPDPQQDSQDPPLEIDIRGVGNIQPDEQKENHIDNAMGKTNEPVITETPGTFNNTNEATNHALLQNPASKMRTNETDNPALNHFLQMGENDNADNIAAQPDPEGKHPNALELIRQGSNRGIREFVEKSANLNRQQQETGEQNPFLNWTGDVARHAMQNPVTHPRQDYQPGLQAILGHEANKKMAEAAAEGIKTDVDGKEKHQIVKEAFTQEYDTETSKQVMALGSLINHALATINDGQMINPETAREVDEKMMDLIGQSDRYIAQSVPIEKLVKLIVKGDDRQTAENFTRFGYETLGGKGPYMLAGTAGGSLVAGAGMTGGAATIYKMTKDFTTNFAEANANIVKETGSHDWELAFKIALQTTLGGRTIDTQMERAAQGRGMANKTVLQIMGDTLKKRFGSMVSEFHLKKVTAKWINKEHRDNCYWMPIRKTVYLANAFSNLIYIMKKKIKLFLILILLTISHAVLATSWDMGNKLYQEKKYERAFPYLKKAASQGNSMALAHLGFMYLEGKGVHQDYGIAFNYYLESAKKGNERGQFGLGYMYNNGLFVKQDYAKAKIWYEQAASQGYPFAMNNLGLLYKNESTDFKDEKKAFEWMKKAAASNDDVVQYNLATFYEKGIGTKKDYTEARKWYEKAVAQGYLPAKANLANLYLDGKGGQKDEPKGLALIKEAANEESKAAQYTLANLYADGEGGLPQNNEQAVYWFQKAAENDSALAMDMLAKAYLNGKYGLPKSPTKWDYWQKRAAETRARTHEVDPSSWTIFDWIRYKLGN